MYKSFIIIRGVNGEKFGFSDGISETKDQNE